MNRTVSDLQLLLSRLLLALLFYPLCKILFFLFNYNHFSDISIGELIRILFVGLRFDLASVMLINLPFIFFHNLPFSFNRSRRYELFLKTIFLLTNGVSLLADCMDMEYYKYTLKRTGNEFFSLLGLGSDFRILLPRYISDFWYILLLWIALLLLLSYLYKKIPIKAVRCNNEQTYSGIKIFTVRMGSWVLLTTILIAGMVIAFRGGLQKKPISPIHAAQYVPANRIPLILNTSFSIIKSFGLEKLKEKKYLTESELHKELNPIKQVNKTLVNPPVNVFIIILESFSKEYTALGKRKSHTPFLDSLMKESLVFDNAFANAKSSIGGIPAILAGIPVLMQEPFITSAYSGNQFDALPGILKNMGYSSAFFHGGTNGTMGFDAFCGSAGIEHYYGRFEYNNEKDYDGKWGIWDEPFLQYSVRKVSEMKEPFCATIFTLSSHHPYNVPDKYSEKFKGKQGIPQRAIAYTDFSLEKFFETVSMQKWYNNTLFVFTADHTSSSKDIFFGNSVGAFQIPVFFFKPQSTLKGTNHNLMQQIDIFPTVLSVTGNNKAYYSIGKNAFDSSEKKSVITYFNNIYQLMQDGLLLQFDGTQSIGLFHYPKDSLLKNNLINENWNEKYAMEKYLKAVIQLQYNGMIYNRISADTYPMPIAQQE